MGADAVPWIGLAATFFFLPVPTGQFFLPWPNVSVPLLILLGGVLFIVARRQSGTARPSDEPDSPVSEDTILPSLSPGSGSIERDILVRLPGRKNLLHRVSEALEHPQSGRAESRRNELQGSGDGREKRAPGPSLIAIRADEYADVTESFGHEASQDLLAAVAGRVDEIAPPAATTARIAEDTFAAVLPKTDADRVWEVGEELAERLEHPFSISGKKIPIGVSIGLATYQSSDSMLNGAEALLRAGYSAMRQVERQEGRILGVYRDDKTSNGSEAGTRFLQRRERLRRAIRGEELVLHYQPIVHLLTGSPVGAEALVRWDHPERGLLSPADFIPLAEETGLIGALDRWVFERALGHAETWTKDPDSPLDWVSVNMSPRSAEGDLQNWCLEKLREAELPDSGLHLEITERWALRGERPLDPLRKEGARLSIDDFGTGYSSLRYLRSLHADVLKIDSEFIQDLGQDPQTTSIVQFLLNLSLHLDVEVIAEGVETAEQESILRDFGCAMAQGYHFSRPVPAETLPERVGAPSSGSELDQ